MIVLACITAVILIFLLISNIQPVSAATLSVLEWVVFIAIVIIGAILWLAAGLISVSFCLAGSAVIIPAALLICAAMLIGTILTLAAMIAGTILGILAMVIGLIVTVPFMIPAAIITEIAKSITAAIHRYNDRRSIRSKDKFTTSRFPRITRLRKQFFASAKTLYINLQHERIQNLLFGLRLATADQILNSYIYFGTSLTTILIGMATLICVCLFFDQLEETEGV